MTGIDRRQFLTRAATGLAAASLPGSVWARAFAQDADPVRVYMVVVDGLRPDEVGFMPQVSELAEAGTFWPDGRAEMIAETTPNHVTMLTGMRGDRHGMPGNAVTARPGFSPQLGDNPRYLKADTLFTLLRRQAPDAVTASITSKTYLVAMSAHDRDGDGEPDTDYVYQPRVIIPVSNHETDHLVMPAAIEASRDLDPDFMFINLGDVDRVGHTDPTGPTPLAVWRTQTLTDTDGQIRLLVEDLKSRGIWEQTVLIVTADHNMDWSTPDSIVNLFGEFEDDGLLAGHTLAADNGGAGVYQLRHPNEPRAGERLARMREIALATDGVREALYTRPNPADGGSAHAVGAVHPEWGLAGDRSGDLVVTVEPGWRVTEPGTFDNPIPGNHGHPITLPIPVIVAGGWEGVASAEITGGELAHDDYDDVRARNLDLAPTVAWLLGAHPPAGGFDGRVLDEAFTMRPPPRVTTSATVAMPRTERLGGSGRAETAVALSGHGWPDGAEHVVLAAGGDFPDALSAVPLAASLDAPLLLTRTASLDPATAAELDRLAPDTVWLVGGEAAISAAVEEQLAGDAFGFEVRRLAGEDRYATAAAVAAEVGSAHGEAILASGGDFPDALAAGPVAAAAGRPVLLTRPGSVPEATLNALNELEIDRVLLAGGTQAVSAAVERDLRERGLVVGRISGTDRYATAAALTERSVREGAVTDAAWLVSGADYPDALAAGPVVARGGGLLVLVPPDALGATAARDLLSARADEFVHVRYVGGTAALTPALEAEVNALIRARRAR